MTNTEPRELLRTLSDWMSIASIEEGTTIQDLQSRLTKWVDKIEQALKENK